MEVEERTQPVTKEGEAPAFAGVDPWQNGVNRNVAGRTARRVLAYNARRGRRRVLAHQRRLPGGSRIGV